ncbi:MAG: hypothetical protein K6E19_04475 [Lachnospiraceae bacterium]|nr:hypothetical protein [Lachnospiraceae bacterium]
MKKQIVIIAEKKDDTVKELEERLENNGYYIYTVSCHVSAVAKIATKTEYFLLMVNEKSKDMLSLLYYLREICIDEEKFLYMIGETGALSEVAGVIPAMIIKGCFSLPYNLDNLIDHINSNVKKKARGAVLYVGQDAEFLSMLRRYIQGTYDFAATEGKVSETAEFIKDAGVVIMDLRAKMSIIEAMELYSLIRETKETKKFKFITLVDPESGKRLKDGIKLIDADYVFSSEMPADRLAAVF